ncbi:MAG TPA: bifunctional UDP-N-acetylglucosamine diphosphorylase/glucosamine-1-phosphate N-acetyltransferase GlmU [Candidatus Binatus sp.]|uniref:bifunctional UDP-N-acetylglucosamine diphosphorylase/glucosamine-1-phosphate N-acetyltransferase GlmU n=1 Tax=Candidatus Binatus sp. TaxID=2811406 RepID=UPI002B478695|nr:bifunctional UDP-N-acetylglucosamine diphosphorylase/glucosamine-1-phosphate N-acetyltransferase GlmU [Candidatus Binatus sp.]HKN15159.1 bifunctional UDP-N-acetylglucosamine diphosphorylase/glucosamine-1-phosphate N-acetyltransferase GlmU [Candidatus Binatus sp.]
MTTSNVAAIILAAGKGTRMRSERAKVLHELCGEPMIARAVRAVAALKPDPIVIVVGHQAREVEAAVNSSNARFALQEPQRGTGDAARCGLGQLPADFTGDVLITYGDMPAIKGSTLRAFLDAHRKRAAKLSFISIILEDPAAYGRVIRDARGNVDKIVEFRDASPAERAIKEINTGCYIVDSALLRSALAELKPANAQDEYYLTDIVAIARARCGNEKVEAWAADDPVEFAGINSREELANMEAEIRAAVNRKLMQSGVTLVDPSTAYISEQAEIAADCVIGPNVQILGACKLAEGVRIDGTAWLSNVTIGPRCHLKLGVRAEDCIIGEESEIGPFANLRAGTELAGHNRIGNFVETKKARLGRGTKASHLSYLGDATIGADTNIGCGVITVNYDGYEKHHTEIGDRCMVGCDTQLVAPVKVGSDVYVASGTTIIREVPDGALVMSHHPQREKSGWMATWRKRHNDSPDGSLRRKKDQ